MIFIWIAIGIWATAMVAVEYACGNIGEWVGTIDITDPEGEDKWGAM